MKITVKSAMDMFGMDDEFFTREEINELADEVEYQLNKTFGSERFVYTEIYLENNVLDMSVMDTDNDYEFNTKMKIDMRRIQKPSDLMKYAPKLAKVFEDEFNRFAEELRMYDVESATNTCGIPAAPNVSGQLPSTYAHFVC